MTVGRSSSPTHQKGAAAEDAALLYLQQRGFVLVAQNFNTRFGELDLIVEQPSLLLFVEVRQRKANALVSAVDSVTPAKQKKIIQSAMIFLQEFPKYQDYACRFDVIALTTSTSTRSAANVGSDEIEWIEAAFDAY
jgi:putative endonuclease